MIFTEQKKDNRFYYGNEDFYGVIKLNSPKKLPPVILDSCVLKISQNSLRSGTIKDEKNNLEIEFEFEPREIWEDDLQKDNK